MIEGQNVATDGQADYNAGRESQARFLTGKWPAPTPKRISETFRYLQRIGGRNVQPGGQNPPTERPVTRRKQP